MKDSILIVDDCPNLHKLIRAYLGDEPITIHSAYNGFDALVAAATLTPGLILLDVDMPEIDGFDVCRRLKANPLTQSVPIVFLTADVSSINQVKGLDLGASDYLIKPLKPEELRARIRAALRMKPLLNDTAMIDGLTRLWNRTYRDLHLPGQLSLARRACQPLTCMMIDIDGLGSINRRFGETVGDEVLRGAGRILTGEARTEDVVCYLDGGKFSVLLPGTLQAGATEMADRARAEMERQLDSFNGNNVRATCSIGIADTRTGSDSSLLDRADAALYGAKSSGRNCVSLSQPTVLKECAVG